MQEISNGVLIQTKENRTKSPFNPASTNSKWIALLLVSTSAWLWLPVPLGAQDFTGFLGRITDPSGAAVVAAQVKATEETSGLSSSTVSNEIGEFELRGILPGAYTLEVELHGFKKYVNRGVVVYARQPRRVDVQLEVGEFTQSVSVEEQGSRIATDTGSTAYKINQRETTYLLHMGSASPIGGGLYMATHNQPGTESAGNGWGVNNSVHGSHANNITTEQDGISTFSHGIFRNPAESVQEINTVAVNGDAEYKTATTIVSVGRSGTNQLHGQVFLQIRHPRLWALTASEKGKPRVPSSPFETWNYDVGGPVYIPKVYDGRNKTFFHFLYQPESGVTTQFVRLWYPTPQMRAGNFSEVVASGQRIVNPFTNQPFPNSTIPDSMISPIAKNILKRVPLPNLGDFYGENYSNPTSDHTHDNWLQFKLDHQLFRNNTLSFSHYRFNAEDLGDWPFSPVSNNDVVDTVRAISIQDSHTFSSRLVNQFIFTWNNQQRTTVAGSASGSSLLKEFGITDLGGRTTPDLSGTPFFGMQILGMRCCGVGSGPQNIFSRTDFISDNSSQPRLFTAKDTISYQRGKHLFKTGLDMSWERPFSLELPKQAWGSWQFTGNMTGFEFSDFLLGLPYSTQIAISRPETRAAQFNSGFFFQDTWKITPNLTLTPGVRFQHYGPPIDQNGLYYNFDFAKGQVVVPDEAALAKVDPAWPKTIPVVTAAQGGYPRNLVNFKTLMFEPRLGLAWRLSDKFVVRMGYGMYHVPYSAFGGTNGEIATGQSNGTLLAGRHKGPFGLTESFGPNQVINGVPQLTLANSFPAAGSGAIPLQSVVGIPVDVRNNNWPDDQQWNLTLERDLGLGFTGRASYVGGKGTHWPYVRDLNTPIPSSVPYDQRPLSEQRPFGSNYAGVLLSDLGGNSTFHGLEVEVNRQFSHGLYLRGWYEWKKALNDVGNGTYGSIAGVASVYGGGIESPYNRAREKGWQEWFMPQRGQIAAVYDLPVGRGQKFHSNLPGALNHILGNWTTGFKFDTYSGLRETPIFTGADPANVGASSGRADLLPGCDPNHVGPTPGQYYNPSCFAVPPNGRLGTAPRGMLYAPRVWQTFFNLFKKWNLTGKEPGPYFQVDMYMFNVFNHRNAASLIADSNNILAPNFGYFSPDPWDSRKIHFRLKLGF